MDRTGCKEEVLPASLKLLLPGAKFHVQVLQGKLLLQVDSEEWSPKLATKRIRDYSLFNVSPFTFYTLGKSSPVSLNDSLSHHKGIHKNHLKG
jgi:hypothetical protein